ncbi:DUF4282 domain-containing protein [Leucobacter sp. 1207-22]|uniref:DUF4282 domain-containing protein n=1 Tax=Leucobacter sp. 1207-22 TaxID=2604456 RepID=UPI0040641916
MTSEQPALPPAGWHPDPTASGRLRHWNGTAWTEEVRPVIPKLGSDTPTNNAGPEQSTPAPEPSRQAAPSTPPGPSSLSRGPVPPASMRPQPVPQRPNRETGFFRSLFDLSFASDRVVTVSFARFIYLLVSILSVLWWLVGTILLFTVGGQSSDLQFLQGIGVLQLVLGPVGVLLTIMFCRVALEVTIAQIRTSQHTAKLVHLTQFSGGGDVQHRK